MKKLENILKLIYDIVNDDQEEVTRETEQYNEEIEKLEKDIFTLIKKNLADAKIERGKKLQKLFEESKGDLDKIEKIDFSVAARSEQDNFIHNDLSKEELMDISRLKQAQEKLNDKSRETKSEGADK
jgi:esterase/lipase